MNNRQRTRIVTILSMLILILGITLLDFHNSSVSHYAPMKGNILDIRQTHQEVFYSVSSLKKDEGMTTFTLVTDHPVALALNHLKYDHEIYFDDHLVSQNIRQDAPHFDYQYAYKVLTVQETTKITIKGERNYTTSVYVASPQVMSQRIELRTFFFSGYVVIYMMVLFTCLLLYVFNPKEYQFLILMLHALIVLIKVIIKGDLYFLTEFLHVTLSVQYALHVFTGILWTIFPAFVVMSYYRVPLSKYVKIGLALLFAIMLIFGMTMDYSVYAVYMMVLSLPFFIYVIYYGIVHKKPFYLLVTFACIFQGCHSFYMALCGAEVLKYGELSFIFYLVGNGLTGFVLIFMSLHIYSHFKKFKVLNEQKLEYQKISILRGIGHDLKLPLSVIKSSNEILHRYDLEQDQRRVYISRSSDAVKELEMMVDNIGDYIDKSNEGEKIAIHECFDKFSKQFKKKDYPRAIDIEFVENTMDAEIGIDYFSFYRLLFNLVDNAIKYSKEHSRVAIYYEITDKVYIYVKDNGIGMTKEELKNATKPFYRANKARTENGMGLGLAVVKSICEKFDIDLSILSKKNAYTTVILGFEKM